MKNILEEEISRINGLMGNKLLNEESITQNLLLEVTLRSFAKTWDNFIQASKKAGKNIDELTRSLNAREIDRFKNFDIGDIKKLKSHFDDVEMIKVWKVILPEKLHDNIPHIKEIVYALDSDPQNTIKKLFKKNKEGTYLMELLPKEGGIRGEILKQAQEKYPDVYDEALENLPTKQKGDIKKLPTADTPSVSTPKVTEPEPVKTPESKGNIPDWKKRKKPGQAGFKVEDEILPEDVAKKYKELEKKSERTPNEQDFIEGYKKWKAGEDVDWEDLKSKLNDDVEVAKIRAEYSSMKPKWYNDNFMWKFWKNQIIPYWKWISNPFINIFKNLVIKLGRRKPKTFERALFELNASFTKGFDAHISKRLEKIGGNAYYRDFLTKFGELPRYGVPKDILESNYIYENLWVYFINQYPKYIKGDDNLVKEFKKFTQKLLEFENVGFGGVEKGLAMKDFLKNMKEVDTTLAANIVNTERQLSKIESDMVKAVNNIPFTPKISDNLFKKAVARVTSYVRGGTFATPKDYEKYLYKEFMEGSLQGVDFKSGKGAYITPNAFKTSQLVKWLMIRYATSQILLPVIVGTIQLLYDGAETTLFDIKRDKKEPVFEDAQGTGQLLINYYVYKILQNKKMPFFLESQKFEGWEKYFSLLPGYQEEIPIMLGKLLKRGLIGGKYTWSQKEAIESNKKLILLPRDIQREQTKSIEWKPLLDQKLMGRQDIIFRENGTPIKIGKEELKKLVTRYDNFDTKNLTQILAWTRNGKPIAEFKAVKKKDESYDFFYRQTTYTDNRIIRTGWKKL